jgi:excisionase family DNA binding protein
MSGKKERLMDNHEVSNLLKHKVSTIYKMVCQRKIPFIKLGSRTVNNRDVIE